MTRHQGDYVVKMIGKYYIKTGGQPKTRQINGRTEYVIKDDDFLIILARRHNANTLLREYKRYKENISIPKREGFIYKYEYGKCDSVYIGETQQTIAQGFTSHFRQAKKLSNFCDDAVLSHILGCRKSVIKIDGSNVNWFTHINPPDVTCQMKLEEYPDVLKKELGRHEKKMIKDTQGQGHNMMNKSHVV